MDAKLEKKLAKAKKEVVRGEHKVAEEGFREVVAADPQNADAHLGLGFSLIERGALDEAYGHLRTAYALRLDENTAYALGHVCTHLGKLDKAEKVLTQAMEIAPYRSDILLAAIFAYEQGHKLDEAEATAQRLLDHNPNNFSARHLMARILRRQGKYEESLSYTELDGENKPPDLVELSWLYSERARCLEAVHRYDEAYQTYQAFAASQRAHYPDLEAEKHTARKAISTQKSKLDALSKSGPAPYFPYIGKSPAFIVGFPRSGTTLVESILDSLELVTVSNEHSPVSFLQSRLNIKEGPHGLIGQDDYQFVEELRGEYWTLLRSKVEVPPGHLLVDKLPFNFVNIRLIHLLFPNAKILFIRRHPLDSVLSCFTQNFEINAYMSHFTSLEDSAHMYAHSMSVWRDALTVLNLDVHVTRYEDLVDDFKTQVRALLAFLNLEWSDSLLTFHRHAATRKINTPSYEQVTQGLYTTSRYRWKNYERQLRPIEKILEPFIDAFDYGEGDASQR